MTPNSPITSCHKVEAKIYSSDEGTSHYFCPTCNQPVNIDGSNPDRPYQDWLVGLLETLWDSGYATAKADKNFINLTVPAAHKIITTKLAESIPKKMAPDTFGQETDFSKGFRKGYNSAIDEERLDELNKMENELYNDGGEADAEVMGTYIKRRKATLKRELEELRD